MLQQKAFVRLYGPVQLASSEVQCWKCRRQTSVHALMVADVVEFVAGEEPRRNEAPSFVYDIGQDAFPPQVKAAVTQVASNFRPLFSRTVGETSWANACVHCGVLLGAFFLHSEPDGPFFGRPEDFDGARVVVFEHGFDVAEASYSI